VQLPPFGLRRDLRGHLLLSRIDIPADEHGRTGGKMGQPGGIGFDVEIAAQTIGLKVVIMAIRKGIQAVPVLEGGHRGQHRKTLGRVLIGRRVVVLADRERHTRHTSRRQTGKRTAG
jgi:hypothetical protein